MLITLAKLVFESIMLLLLMIIIHESSHLITSCIFGKPISRYKIDYLFIGDISIPRLVWDMPNSLNNIQRTIVGISGYFMEILIGLIIYFIEGDTSFSIIYRIVLVIRLIIANLLFYMKDDNYSDFQYF